MSRVLVSQLARMGDLTQSLYLLGDLTHGEGHQVSVLVDRRLGPFVRARAPWLQTVYELDVERYLRGFRMGIRWTRLWRALADELRPLREACFDRVINLNYGELPAAVTESIRGQAVAEGFRRDGAGSFGDPWVDFVSRLVQSDRRWNRFHLVDVFRFHSLRRRSGAQEEKKQVAEPLSDRSVLGMQIGTRCPKRTWGTDGFIEVVRGLQRDVGCEILLLGEARERRQAEHIVRRADCGRLRDLAGKTSLEDLAQILASCDRLLSGDTGTLHLAAYLGVPSLGIYMGPAYVFETGPYGPGHLVLQAAPPCGPCSEEAPCERDACRKGIHPESVLQLLKGELPSSPSGVGAYASGFLEGWLQYRPLHRGQATGEDVIGFLYLGSASAYLDTPPGRLPSLAGALQFLFSHYEVSRSVLRTVYDSLEGSLPVRMGHTDRQALLGALRRGWTQMREMLDGSVAQESGCPATAAA